jgi:S1-C subfamily serine protease
MSLGTTRTPPRILGMFAAGLMVATALTAGISVLPSSPVQAQQELQAAPIDPSRGFADLVDRVMPAVVSVQVKFANVAASGEQGGLQIPGLPEGSPFGDFFRQFPQLRPGPGMPDQGQRPEALLWAPASSSLPMAMRHQQPCGEGRQRSDGQDDRRQGI